MKLSKPLKNRLKEALREDIGPGDVTSRLLIPGSARGKAVIVARESGIFCGGKVASEIFKLRDSGLAVSVHLRDGQRFSKGRVLMRVEGRIISILEAERTVLNLLGRLCGIATLTREFTKRAGRARILDTRKTTPLWRDLEKYAVRTGGGASHRMGLFDELFVKENHRRFGDLNKLKACAGRFVLEVRNLKELAHAFTLKPRVILLDNFTPDLLRKAVRLARKTGSGALLEASGGVNLQNVRAFAATGVDQISVGALTHSVKPVDLSLLIT